MTRLTMVSAVVLLASPALAAQEGEQEPVVAVAPTILEQDGDYTVGARFDLLAGSRRHEVTRAFPRSRYWRVEAKGTLAADADLNPDPLSLGAAGGVAWSLAKPRVIVFNPANVDAPESAMEFDYGDISLGFQGLMEMNQPRTEGRVSLNLELIYTHDHQGGIWPFIPSVYAMIGAARSLTSDVRDSLSISDTQSYVRLAGGAAWHLSADRSWVPVFMRPVWLHAEIDVYREDGGTTMIGGPGGARQGPLDGTRVALGAAYRILAVDRGLIDEVFIRWTNGETPTLPGNRKAWRVGILLAP